MLYVYIVTNKYNSVLYTGVTNNLEKRIYEHKNKLIPGFTERYNISKLIFYEMFYRPEEAIEIVKKIKGWKRIKKLELIKRMNPDFKDLSVEI